MFAAHLRISQAYVGPAIRFWAIISEAQAQGSFPSFDPEWLSGTAAALHRGLPTEEQAAPPTVPVLCQTGSAVRSHEDTCLMLTLMRGMFSVASRKCPRK